MTHFSNFMAKVLCIGFEFRECSHISTGSEITRLFFAIFTYLIDSHYVQRSDFHNFISKWKVFVEKNAPHKIHSIHTNRNRHRNRLHIIDTKACKATYFRACNLIGKPLCFFSLWIVRTELLLFALPSHSVCVRVNEKKSDALSSIKMKCYNKLKSFCVVVIWNFGSVNTLCSHG